MALVTCVQAEDAVTTTMTTTQILILNHSNDYRGNLCNESNDTVDEETGEFFCHFVDDMLVMASIEVVDLIFVTEEKC
jgi:hypothetical protein